jgi:hypothetical protein
MGNEKSKDIQVKPFILTGTPITGNGGLRATVTLENFAG